MPRQTVPELKESYEIYLERRDKPVDVLGNSCHIRRGRTSFRGSFTLLLSFATFVSIPPLPTGESEKFDLSRDRDGIDTDSPPGNEILGGLGDGPRNGKYDA